MPPESLLYEWHALAEIVTAAILVAVVYPQSQGLYRRLTRPARRPPSFSPPDFAYAASTVLRPGETSTLRYGEESQKTSSESIPTILRKFGDLSLSDHATVCSATEPGSSSSSGEVSTPPCVAPTSSIVNRGKLGHTTNVRFDPSLVDAASSPTEVPSAPPSPHSLHSTQPGHVRDSAQQRGTPIFDTALLPPPIRRAARIPGSLRPATDSLRATSAPPSEPLSPVSEDEFDLPDASASTAPKTKGKAKVKGKQKLQSSVSLSSRSFSTPPMATHDRPKTRSMSAAPDREPSTIASTSNSTGANEDIVDIPPVDSYLRHSTKRAAWFESSSGTLIAHPPDFSSRGDVELEDVFIHKVKDTYQLWIWEKDSTGQVVWKRVWLGYPRPSDGRKLTVTPTRKEPSWVSEQWASKTAKRRAP
ncbi:hypothetical protein BDY19DRAFT_998747 [Irpex rosettiformis]|uniref:Uncharacterized protein n=1 Tax=Irpex rosettiformis TaxID=378272 RepID=A0ACB8TML0_9APHY|nr:hypothetical protein BDY19DRAFT_998747 [Irpex rosettiformis]